MTNEITVVKGGGVDAIGEFTCTRYLTKNLEFHREDGPAYIIKYKDGFWREVWYYENIRHRYGGPAVTTRNGANLYYYYVHDKYVTNEVEEWLLDNGYIWEDMSDVEKWELDLFMRSL